MTAATETVVDDSQPYIVAGPIPHAPWCVDNSTDPPCMGGCDGRNCWSDGEPFTVTATGDNPRPPEDDRAGDVLGLLNVVVHPGRLLAWRPAEGMAPDDTHVVKIGIGHERFCLDMFASLTVAQAKQLVARLDDCLALVEADAQVLRTFGIGSR